MKRQYSIGLALGLALYSSLLTAAQPVKQAVIDGAVNTISSSVIDCLAVNPAELQTNKGVVHLQWQGRATHARLLLTVAGTEAAQPIKINDQLAATVPPYAAGAGCGDGEVFYLDIPPALLVQGVNQIELTEDGLAGDQWYASHVRLEVLGAVTAPLPTTRGRSGEGAVVAQTASTISYRNPYDQSTQQARVQTPSSYKGAPTPLLIVVHPRSTDMFWGENAGYLAATEQKGWFYVAPQLHGSWPGTSALPVPNPPGKFAYASTESQYDIVGSIQFMVEQYNIDPNRIYIYGQSMGAQVAEVTTAHFPHLFAAAFYNKGPSDWTAWYEQTKALIANGYSQSFHKQWMEHECFQLINGVPTPQTPNQNPFCYQRRSGLTFAENFAHVPVAFTHSSVDRLVPVSHTTQLHAAINQAAPDRPAMLTIDTAVGPTCTDGEGEPTPYYHCYENDPAQVLAFLEQFTRVERPTHLRLKTAESSTFYWLKLDRQGATHLSSIEASYDLNQATVTVHSSDPTPLALGFNLGTTPINQIIPQAGMGLPLTTYLVQEEGEAAYLTDYQGGYLTTVLHTVGEVELTIAAVQVAVTAEPPVKVVGEPTVITLTVELQDRLNHWAPDQTPVTLTTTAGQFPNGSTSFIGATKAGKFQVQLTLAGADGAAQIVASVGSSPMGATGTAEVTLSGALPSPTLPPTVPATPTPTAPTQEQQIFLPLIQR